MCLWGHGKGITVQLGFCTDAVIIEKERILLTSFTGRSSCHQKKKKKGQKYFINSLLRVLLMKKEPCFPKLISSMVTDNFLCLIFLKSLSSETVKYLPSRCCEQPMGSNLFSGSDLICWKNDHSINLLQFMWSCKLGMVEKCKSKESSKCLEREIGASICAVVGTVLKVLSGKNAFLRHCYWHAFPSTVS